MRMSSVREQELHERTKRLLSLKNATGKSFDQIANEIGLTNTYTCQASSLLTSPANVAASHSCRAVYLHFVTIDAACMQLFLGQAQLKPDRAEKLKKAVPGIEAEDIKVRLQRLPPSPSSIQTWCTSP